MSVGNQQKSDARTWPYQQPLDIYRSIIFNRHIWIIYARQ